MALALEVELKTIAFPAISSGVYRFPMPRANKIATGTVAGILRSNTMKRRTLPVNSLNCGNTSQRAVQLLVSWLVRILTIIPTPHWWRRCKRSMTDSE